MAGKVLLGLLAAGAVTGSAMVYSGGYSGGCPLSGSSCDATAAAVTCSASADEPASCCAAKNRAAACCEGMEEGMSSGGDAIAALTGGACLAR